ncbi:unnamed protein product [Dovyalis caffra]|uniref:Uncharacterized protein n=1 Tax=Dovyalis caffra TaxID=77055 RepID=A0AAV1RBB2_9ROSI|nr:unnamed protein product [Dovyalis caffra]
MNRKSKMMREEIWKLHNKGVLGTVNNHNCSLVEQVREKIGRAIEEAKKDNPCLSVRNEPSRDNRMTTEKRDKRKKMVYLAENKD